MYLDITVTDHQFRLFPQRAVLWRDASCLLLADLHLGKADTFRQHGIAVPQTVQRTDLERLDAVLTEARPQRCVVLGDFVHGAGHGTETVASWRALVAAHPATSFELVVGNHDRLLEPQVWNFAAVVHQQRIANVLLSHEPANRQDLLAQEVMLNIHGHIHPAWRLPGGHTKLPALVHQAPYLMLPAFSEFTAGVAQRMQKQAAWVFVESEAAVVRVN